MRRLVAASLLALGLDPCGGEAPWSPEGRWDWKMPGAICTVSQQPATGTVTFAVKDGRLTGKLDGCAGAVSTEQVDGLVLPDGRFAIWLFEDSDIVVTKITAPDRNHFLGQVTGVGRGVTFEGVRP